MRTVRPSDGIAAAQSVEQLCILLGKAAASANGLVLFDARFVFRRFGFDLLKLRTFTSGACSGLNRSGQLLVALFSLTKGELQQQPRPQLVHLDPQQQRRSSSCCDLFGCLFHQDLSKNLRKTEFDHAARWLRLVGIDPEPRGYLLIECGFFFVFGVGE